MNYSITRTLKSGGRFEFRADVREREHDALRVARGPRRVLEERDGVVEEGHVRVRRVLELELAVRALPHEARRPAVRQGQRDAHLVERLLREAQRRPAGLLHEVQLLQAQGELVRVRRVDGHRDDAQPEAAPERDHERHARQVAQQDAVARLDAPVVDHLPRHGQGLAPEARERQRLALAAAVVEPRHEIRVRHPADRRARLPQQVRLARVRRPPRRRLEVDVRRAAVARLAVRVLAHGSRSPRRPRPAARRRLQRFARRRAARRAASTEDRRVLRAQRVTTRRRDALCRSRASCVAITKLWQLCWKHLQHWPR